VEFLKNAGPLYSEYRPGEKTDVLEFEILQCLDRAIGSDIVEDIVRREASMARELILVHGNPSALKLLKFVREKTGSMPETGRFMIPFDYVANETDFGRVLALASAQDFGLTARKNRSGYLVIRGDVYRRQLWRVLDEVLHPDPAKRQGFTHTVGRKIMGSICARSRLLAEMSETKVAGERLYLSQESSWRPYMPTVDDFLALTTGEFVKTPLKIFSAGGVFEIPGPSSWFARKHLWWTITSNYRRYAGLRNLEAGEIHGATVRGIIRVFSEDTDVEMSFHPHVYTYQGQPYSVMDPVVEKNLYPACMVRGERN